MQSEKIVNQTWWTLRIAFGVVPIIAGLDKFTNLLTNWTNYLSPLAIQVLPISPPGFMKIVGVIEIIAGIIVLSKWTRVGAWIVCVWLVAIAVNLVTTGHYFDIAVRDLVMAVGASSLARLSHAREIASVPETRATAAPRVPAHA